jgi:hypothetical protein
MAGKSRGPTSLAGAAGRLSVQEGHGDEALRLVQSDSFGQRGAQQRGVWPNNGGDKAKWAMAPSVMPGAVVRGPSHVGR